MQDDHHACFGRVDQVKAKKNVEILIEKEAEVGLPQIEQVLEKEEVIQEGEWRKPNVLGQVSKKYLLHSVNNRTLHTFTLTNKTNCKIQ